MLLLLLYAVLLLLFRFVRIRKSKTMPPVLAYSIAEADSICVARTLLYHTHALTTSEALLLVSRSPELLLSHDWSLFTDFGMLQYIANLCWQPKPVVRTVKTVPETVSHAVPETIVEPLPEPVPVLEPELAESLPAVEVPVVEESVEAKPRKKGRTSKSVKAA